MNMRLFKFTAKRRTHNPLLNPSAMSFMTSLVRISMKNLNSKNSAYVTVNGFLESN